MSISHVYFGDDRIMNEINRMSSQENRIEYAPLMWENQDNEIDSFPEIMIDPLLPGKYSTTITTILSKQCNEIKNNSEERPAPEGRQRPCSKRRSHQKPATNGRRFSH